MEADLKYVAATLPSQQSIAYGDNAFLQTGYYVEPDFS